MKILQLAVLTVAVSSTASYAGSNLDITVPPEFYEVDGRSNVHLFYDYMGNAVVVADIDAGATLTNSTGSKITTSSGEYYYKLAMDGDRLRGGAFAAVNGTFFGNPTDRYSDPYARPSLPFNPGYNTWANGNQTTRTLCIRKSDNKAVVVHTGSNKPTDYNTRCSYSVTMLDPSSDRSRSTYIGRHYIGVSKDNTEVLFFISRSKTQSEMLDIINSLNIPSYHIIMGDGSASAQLVNNDLYLYGKSRPWGGYHRSIPHVIKIYN